MCGQAVMFKRIVSLRGAFCVLFLPLVISACGGDPVDNRKLFPDNPADCDVLMIGNSLTAYYDTPGILQALCDSSGKKVFIREAMYLGKTLGMIVSVTDVFDHIALRKWDYAVMQGSSYEIAFPEYHDEIAEPIEILAGAIRANNPDTRIIFFMDWAMKNGVSYEGHDYTYEQFQSMLRKGTLLMAGRMGFIVAPIGVAFNTVIAERPEIDLFHPDGGHPSAKGSYLQACVYYSAIFRETAAGIDVFGDVPQEQARYLQGVGSATVLDSLDQWNITPD